MSGSYYAFMLRIWRTTEPGAAAGRASLEDAHSGEVRAFASIEALAAHLGGLARTATGSSSAESDRPPQIEQDRQLRR